jgi:hypothetical protein
MNLPYVIGVFDTPAGWNIHQAAAKACSMFPDCEGLLFNDMFFRIDQTDAAGGIVVEWQKRVAGLQKVEEGK